MKKEPKNDKIARRKKEDRKTKRQKVRDRKKEDKREGEYFRENMKRMILNQLELAKHMKTIETKFNMIETNFTILCKVLENQKIIDRKMNVLFNGIPDKSIPFKVKLSELKYIGDVDGLPDQEDSTQEDSTVAELVSAEQGGGPGEETKQNGCADTKTGNGHRDHEDTKNTSK